MVLEIICVLLYLKNYIIQKIVKEWNKNTCALNIQEMTMNLVQNLVHYKFSNLTDQYKNDATFCNKRFSTDRSI